MSIEQQPSNHMNKQSSSQQIPQPKSILQQTLQQIQNRVTFFSSHNLSAQNSLNPSNTLTVRSISEIISPLKYFHLAQTPLNLNLSSIYANQQTKHSIKWSIPPPSQGQDSINEQQIFQPSFKWLISAIIDPSLLQIDQPEPRRIQKGRVPQEWRSVNQLLLMNITKKKIYIKSQVQQIQQTIKKKFTERYVWLKFKRAKQVYYRGKPALLLKFSDANSASFVYYNYATFKSNREEFGEECEIFRVTKNQTKDYSKQKNWIIVLFRHLPLSMTKEQLMSLLGPQQETGIKWIQEMIEICGAKYTIGKVSYLDEALQLCSLFNSKKIKQAKINIHPKSSKNWKAQEMMQQQESNEQQNIIVENQTIKGLQEQY